MTNDTPKTGQIYDRTLKALMEDHTAEMLPEFLPEAEFCEEKNIEIARNNLRADIVYLIIYRGLLCILHLELQTASENEMPYRMLLYHVELYGKYKLPVISIVVYLFKTSVPEPVFHEALEDETLLHFEHRVLRLWEVEGEQYLRRHMVCMYTLLPAMKGITKEMLIQAISEMGQHYSDDEEHLGHHLSRFQKILRRTTMISEQDKAVVQEHLRPYDKLIDEDPDVKERMAQSEARGEARGITIGEAIGDIKARQELVITIIDTRFPTLLETAKEQVTHINKSDLLNKLVRQMLLAPDETTASNILNAFAA